MDYHRFREKLCVIIVYLSLLLQIISVNKIGWFGATIWTSDDGRDLSWRFGVALGKNSSPGANVLWAMSDLCDNNTITKFKCGYASSAQWLSVIGFGGSFLAAFFALAYTYSINVIGSGKKLIINMVSALLMQQICDISLIVIMHKIKDEIQSNIDDSTINDVDLEWKSGYSCMWVALLLSFLALLLVRRPRNFNEMRIEHNQTSGKRGIITVIFVFLGWVITFISLFSPEWSKWQTNDSNAGKIWYGLSWAVWSNPNGDGWTWFDMTDVCSGDAFYDVSWNDDNFPINNTMIRYLSFDDITTNTTMIDDLVIETDDNFSCSSVNTMKVCYWISFIMSLVATCTSARLLRPGCISSNVGMLRLFRTSVGIAVISAIISISVYDSLYDSDFQDTFPPFTDGSIDYAYNNAIGAVAFLIVGFIVGFKTFHFEIFAPVEEQEAYQPLDGTSIHQPKSAEEIEEENIHIQYVQAYPYYENP